MTTIAGPGVLLGMVGFMGFLLLAAILLVIGAVLFALMLMRLPETPNVESGFKTAGILYLVGIILFLIPIINFAGVILVLVAIILVFVYSDSTLKRLEATSSSAT